MLAPETDPAARIAELERELGDADGRFAALIEGLQVGVVVQGPRSEIILANPKALELLDMSAEQLSGRSSLDPSWNIIREDGRPFLGEDRPVLRALETRGPIRDVTMGIFRPSRGDRVWLLVSAMPQLRPDGEVVQVIATFTDITSRKLIEEHLAAQRRELAMARDAALAANRAKNTFLSNMSHELRTPLNAVIGYTDLMLEEPDPENAQADLIKVKRSALHLLALIDDVLEITRIEAGRAGVREETFDPQALAEELADVAKVLAERGDNAVHLTCWGAPGLVCSDPRRVRQVLFNLLGNACKFCRDGLIELEFRSEVDSVTFTIRDSGAGISAEHIDSIFEPFVQIEASRIRGDEGVGLGLAISKQLAEALGGELRVESELGRGSAFHLSLPRRLAEG